MVTARKKVEAVADEWVGMVVAKELSGKSRVYLLTQVIAGNLVAKHEAGRTIVSRASLNRLISTLPKKRK